MNKGHAKHRHAKKWAATWENVPSDMCAKRRHHETRLYNSDPLEPHFYIVKLGFTGVYIIFLTSALKHRLWVLVRTASPRRFYRVPTIYILSRSKKNITIFHLNIFVFSAVKFTMYLYRRVFVMLTQPAHPCNQTLSCPHEGTLLPWLSKKCSKWRFCPGWGRAHDRRYVFWRCGKYISTTFGYAPSIGL